MTATDETMGRLERVDLREGWETEDGDFTPWLAEDDNIALLGETIGLKLEVEATEKQVGPFRADILCLDTSAADDHWILIENQLNRTDHRHLGQLMTYAAGLEAFTIVWIARQFTDEHRAALDWLNEITAEEFRFFGLEVELWRIGNSAMAPKFNIVSKPNDWITATSRARRGETTELTPHKQLQVDFWGELHTMMQERDGNIGPRKPYPKYYENFGIGRSGFGLTSTIYIKKDFVEVYLWFGGSNKKAHFALILEEKDEIEQELGEPPEWGEMDNCYVSYWREDYNLKNRDNWPEYLEWMYEKLEALHRVFAHRIKDLDADDYIPDETDLEEDEEQDEND